MALFRIAFLLFFFVFNAYVSSAQENSADSVKSDVVVDHRITELVNKHIEINERTNGKIQGFRVKIHFGLDRHKAKEIKTSFLTKYPEVPAYEKYQQPNFSISVGNFRTRLEAYKFLKEISADFPGAFIVQDEIELHQ